MCQIFVCLCLVITTISFSSYHRGRSISSLQVPKCSYYVGYKWVSANTRTTCGKIWMKKNCFCVGVRALSVTPWDWRSNKWAGVLWCLCKTRPLGKWRCIELLFNLNLNIVFDDLAPKIASESWRIELEWIGPQHIGDLFHYNTFIQNGWVNMDDTKPQPNKWAQSICIYTYMNSNLCTMCMWHQERPTTTNSHERR